MYNYITRFPMTQAEESLHNNIIYIYMCVYVYILYVHVHMYMYIYIYAYMYIYIYVYVCVYIYIYIYVCVYIYIYVCVYIYIYMCMCIYIYICMCIVHPVINFQSLINPYFCSKAFFHLATIENNIHHQQANILKKDRVVLMMSWRCYVISQSKRMLRNILILFDAYFILFVCIYTCNTCCFTLFDKRRRGIYASCYCQTLFTTDICQGG